MVSSYEFYFLLKYRRYLQSDLTVRCTNTSHRSEKWEVSGLVGGLYLPLWARKCVAPAFRFWASLPSLFWLVPHSASDHCCARRTRLYLGQGPSSSYGRSAWVPHVSVRWQCSFNPQLFRRVWLGGGEGTEIQEYLRDFIGSVSDHCSKTSCTNFCFPVHIKVMFILYTVVC